MCMCVFCRLLACVYMLSGERMTAPGSSSTSVTGLSVCSAQGQLEPLPLLPGHSHATLHLTPVPARITLQHLLGSGQGNLQLFTPSQVRVIVNSRFPAPSPRLQAPSPQLPALSSRLPALSSWLPALLSWLPVPSSQPSAPMLPALHSWVLDPGPGSSLRHPMPLLKFCLLHLIWR